MRAATLAGCGAIALWSLLALLTRAASGMPPLELTAFSFSVSAVLGLGIVAARGQLAALRQRPLVWLHGVGGLFGFHALYFAALHFAPVAEANLINYLWPLLIVLLSAALLALRLTIRHWLGIALAVGGCLLLLGGRAHFDVRGTAALGYLLALASATVWALYSVLARRLAAVPTDAIAGFCVVTAILAWIAHAGAEPTYVPTFGDLVVCGLLGAGPVGAAFFLWDIGMKRGDPRLLGTLAYAAPVGSTLLLCAAGFAPFTLTTVLAACLVAAGGLVSASASRASEAVQTASTRLPTWRREFEAGEAEGGGDDAGDERPGAKA
jgi:drug/metabolite transporter (DMT)-like permease